MFIGDFIIFTDETATPWSLKPLTASSPGAFSPTSSLPTFQSVSTWNHALLMSYLQTSHLPTHLALVWHEFQQSSCLTPGESPDNCKPLHHHFLELSEISYSSIQSFSCQYPQPPGPLVFLPQDPDKPQL